MLVFFFQLCVIANNVLGTVPQFFVISKVTMLVFFGAVLLKILQKGKIRVAQILLLPILFTLYCAATILWARNPSAAFSQMVTQVQLFLLLVFTFWAMNDGVTVRDYLQAMYISGFGLMILALYQYGGITQYINAMLKGERMGGEIVNQNTFGMVFGNAALCAAYYMILKGKRWHILSFAAFSFFALSSASRKAMLMIVMGVVAIAVLHFGIRRIYKAMLLIMACGVVLLMALNLPFFGEIGERVENFISGKKDQSDIYRNEMIVFGLEMFKERPIHGYGIANYAQLHYLKTYSHNNYIELMVSGGVIALVGYYLMLLIPAVQLLLSKKKGEKLEPLHLMLWVWLAVEMVFGVALVQLYRKDSWLLMGVLMGESVRALHKKPELQVRLNEAGQNAKENTA